MGDAGGTGTDLPLTFIVTSALPSVSSSSGPVSVGIVSPTLYVCSSISFVPAALTRQTYTVPVGVSCSFTLVGAGGVTCRF